VQDEEEVVLEREDNSFADPPQPDYALPLARRDRRVEGAQEGGRANADALQDLAHDPRLESVQVQRDLAELRHLAERAVASRLSDRGVWDWNPRSVRDRIHFRPSPLPSRRGIFRTYPDTLYTPPLACQRV